jgi:PAS domain S-box-containing protein
MRSHREGSLTNREGSLTTAVWPRLGARGSIIAAALLYIAIYAVRLARGGSGVDAADILLTMPLVLLALRFGIRGGLVGACLGFALLIVWGAQDHDPAMDFNAYLSWGSCYVLLALVVGSFVRHRERLEAILTRYFEQSLDLLTTVDLEGRFVRVNPSWERTLGYPPNSLCGRPFIELVHPDDREATLAEDAVVSTGARDAVGFRNRYRAADGSYRWLEWSAHAAPHDGLIHASARDVTALVEAERREAEHAELLEKAVEERTRDLLDARAKTLKRLALAAEYRDDDTFEHTERVGVTAADIAGELGMDSEQIEILRLAAPLHDVGKIGIPDSILLKPGKFTPEEYEVMKTHTELGARLLAGSGSPVLQMATVIAQNHHERWDGTGYPAGLAGDATPLVGRIVAVADVFDALTHERPYKRAWSVEDSLAEIRRGAGTQFDSRVVDAFLTCHARRSPMSPPRSDSAWREHEKWREQAVSRSPKRQGALR